MLLLARRADRMASLGLPNTIIAEVDVRDRAALQDAVADAETQYGPLDCLVNNAGLMQLGELASQDPVEYEAMVGVNILGVLNGCSVALASMAESGRGTIINVSSLAGRKAYPNHVAYVGTKFAVTGLTENLRQEVAGSNIRVSVVEPGAVETELLGHTTSSDLISGYEQWKDSIGGALDADAVVRAIRYIYDQPQSVCIREVVLASTGQEG